MTKTAPQCKQGALIHKMPTHLQRLLISQTLDDYGEIGSDMLLVTGILPITFPVAWIAEAPNLLAVVPITAIDVVAGAYINHLPLVSRWSGRRGAENIYVPFFSNYIMSDITPRTSNTTNIPAYIKKLIIFVITKTYGHAAPGFCFFFIAKNFPCILPS